ncbi:PadR family transcriptional regulator [Krasilnikovia sp. MM14-A1259]
MREQTYFILASLLDEPRHGYAIIQQVEQLSQGSVKLAAGTLYAAIDRLHDQGYVRNVREEVVNGRARRYYGLTSDGQAALRAEAQRMVAAARVVTEHARADRRGFGAAVTA